ncbi:MAG: LysR family transcriptional regulator [Rubrivivax sp.]|nr:LysR family transcriptional regulator [Rubrivivax sp.]
MRRIPSLARLRTFEVAAQELHLTASAVSHQMRELEAHFGRPLFERRHRRVQTTPEGRRLHESLARVFDALEAACAEVALPAHDQVLAVHCAPSLAIKWLGPLLPAFLAAHPQVNVRLSTGAEALDLAVVREVDVALAYGAPPPQRGGVEVVALGAERIVPLVAPALLPPAARPAELVQRLTLIDSTLSPLGWPEWFERQGLALPARPRPGFDRAAMAIAAATDGLGVALESTRLAARELERGELVELGAKSFRAVARAVHHLCVRHADRQRPAVRAFVDWVLAAAL